MRMFVFAVIVAAGLVYAVADDYQHTINGLRTVRPITQTQNSL